MYDGGKMDGADIIPVTCDGALGNCPPPNPQFWYVNPSEVQPYFQMAEQYTFGDRMFQTNQGAELSRAPVHYFRHLCAHGSQQPVHRGECRREFRKAAWLPGGLSGSARMNLST